MCDMCAAPDPAYDRYLRELERDERRAQSRRGKPAPHRWGDRLDAESYFCEPCWFTGVSSTGAHPYSVPPCDPITRWHKEA